MFFSFVSVVHSLRPFVIVPSMLGSVLYGDIHDLRSHWYCSKNMENHWIWIADKYLIPPMTNCMAEYLECGWNETSQKSGSRPEANIYTIDFGGDKAIRYLDPGIFGKHFFPNLVYLFDHFAKRGYKIKESMFGAPFDWRLNPVAIDDYFPQLKNLIEEAYRKGGNQKVALYTLSAGSMALHTFFTKIVSKEWKEKYISRILIHGPSLPGGIDTLETLWQGKISFMPEKYDTQSIRDFALSLPTLHAHLLNHHIYGDDPIVIGPQGEQYTAKDLPELLKAHGKIPSKFLKMFDFGSKYPSNEIIDIEIPTYFLFNSVLTTARTLVFKNGWDKPYQKINTTGDDTISQKGLFYMCNKWIGKLPLICHDLRVNNPDYNHGGQIHHNDVLDIVWKVINEDGWMVPGKHNATGTTTDDWSKF